MIGFSCGESEEDVWLENRQNRFLVSLNKLLEARMQAVEDSLAAVEALDWLKKSQKPPTFDEAGLYTIQIGHAFRNKANQIC